MNNKIIIFISVLLKSILYTVKINKFSTEWKVTNTERINYRTLKINNINTKNIKLNIDKKNDEIYPMF